MTNYRDVLTKLREHQFKARIEKLKKLQGADQNYWNGQEEAFNVAIALLEGLDDQEREILRGHPRFLES